MLQLKKHNSNKLESKKQKRRQRHKVTAEAFYFSLCRFHFYRRKFIGAEGLDGSGKSTQITLVMRWLCRRADVVFYLKVNPRLLVKRNFEKKVVLDYWESGKAKLAVETTERALRVETVAAHSSPELIEV